MLAARTWTVDKRGLSYIWRHFRISLVDVGNVNRRKCIVTAGEPQAEWYGRVYRSITVAVVHGRFLCASFNE